MSFKSNKFWIILLSAAVLTCIALSLLIGMKPAGIAYVYSGGQFVEAIDLSALAEQRFLTVYTESGGFNVIEASQGRIRVADADCANRECVRRGWVSNAMTPIVCLPHGLIVTIESRANTDIDGAVG